MGQVNESTKSSAVPNERFAPFVQIVDMPELASDTRFATNA